MIKSVEINTAGEAGQTVGWATVKLLYAPVHRMFAYLIFFKFWL